MAYNQYDHHNTHQQKQQDIFAQLRSYRQQLAIWHQDQANIEQRLIVFRQRQQALQTQIDIWHRERDYLFELMEREERQQRHRHDDSLNSMK